MEINSIATKFENDLHDLLRSKNLTIKFRKNNIELWKEVLNKVFYKSVSYTNYSIDYQLAFQNSNLGIAKDYSFIIYWDNKPTAICPISFLINSNNKIEISSQGRPILPPLFTIGTSNVSIKKINQIYLNVLDTICKDLDIFSYKLSSFFINNKSLLIWHSQIMKYSNKVDLSHDLYVNLSLELNEIKNKFRTSYKSLITSGLKHFKLYILEEYNINIWNEFRRLHLNEAGRVTRNDETWDLQLKSINDKDSLFIYIRDINNEMVGGALIDYTIDEGYYSIAAYKRSLFDKPLGHIIQFKAIELLKEKNVKFYYLGVRYYECDSIKPTAKQIKIADFKEGFSTNLYSRYNFEKKY